MHQALFDSRLSWFTEARFGLFIHWGIYAIPGGQWKGQCMDYIGEWIQARYRIPNREYEKLAKQFNPQSFDADAWVHAAYEAGMRYLVFTAKHHDGFAMYHSSVDDFNIVDATPFGRDPLAEIAEACGRYKMRLGVYYSQDLDWHHPDGGDPGPNFYKNLGMSWGNDWDFPELERKDFNRYFNQKALPQVRELLTQYGEISLIWFDCPVSINSEQSEQLVRLVRELQPGCLINSRVGNEMGDFSSMGDNCVPMGKPPGIWETAATLNDTWGFKYSDHNWKSSADVLCILSALASRETNYLLNVGPGPDGCFPTPSRNVLNEIGNWMRINSTAIHGTRGNPFPSEFEWGFVTVSSKSDISSPLIHLHRRSGFSGDFVLRGLKTPVRHVYERSRLNEPLSFTQATCNGIPELRLKLPLTQSTAVTTLELASEIEIDSRIVTQQGEVAILSAATGSFKLAAREDTDQINDVGSTIGAAGELLRLGAVPHVDSTGITVNWRNEKDAMEWNVVLMERGEYAVEILTSSFYFRHDWKGGHRVRLRIGEREILGELKGGRSIKTVDTHYYSLVASTLGNLQLDAGEYLARLSMDYIAPNDDLGITFVSVLLRKK